MISSLLFEAMDGAAGRKMILILPSNVPKLVVIKVDTQAAGIRRYESKFNSK